MQGHFAIGDNEKNKTIVIFSSSLSPSGKLPVRRSSLKTLNKLPSTRAFSAAEKWTVRSTGVSVYIFLLKTETKPATLIY